MAQFSKLRVTTEMQSTGFIPLYYNADIEIIKKVVSACYKGGIRIFEFTNRGDFAHEVFAELVKYANQHLPGLILGVGSVVDPGTTALYLQLGANFIVSPILNEEMAKICNRRKVLWSPGCGSVSEISKAEELGAEIIKIFPATQVGGPQFIAAVRGPMPWSNLMPSSGVEPSEENLSSWFKAGAFCVGMGSKLITKEIILANDYKKLEDKVRLIIALIQTIKGKIKNEHSTNS
ncbi:MAG: bifunctional 4-hydroxy-2-oxoglutarate aldolase/2-dehydro-3-deoxy-phosphogluconate aldolase [Bacteroidales bacterium]|nr:bifunctional 4-hydroxy-2-oxoglutarate aldolase/2-dehydro-3-deoxy-phosphogluconate aldolase [Bacteroidales bacterium]